MHAYDFANNYLVILLNHCYDKKNL